MATKTCIAMPKNAASQRASRTPDAGKHSGKNRKYRNLEGKWSGRRDLNSRPLAPQASALAGLRYAPTEIGIKPAKILPRRGCVSITKICQFAHARFFAIV